MRILFGVALFVGFVWAQGWRVEVVRQAEALPVREHVEVVRELRKRLARRLLDAPGENTHRLLNRGAVEGLIPVRGGGAFFSFTCVEDRYGGHADLSLERWEFRAHHTGQVVSMGVRDLASITVADVPAPLRAGTFEQYGYAPVHVGRVYAVRAIHGKRTDVLAVLKVLAKDEYGVTFRWRILEER